MQVDVLKEYVELARSLNFTQTARKLYVSQSVLSKHINQLEKELGVALLSRTQHHVELTDAGETLLRKLDEVLPKLDNAMRLAKESSGGRSLVKLGYLHGASQGYLANAYSSFSASHPDVDVQLTMMEQGRTMAALEGEEVDLVLTSTCGNALDGKYCTRLLFVDDFGILLRRSHRLADRNSVSIDDLRGEHIYIAGEGNAPSFSQYLTARLEMLGFADLGHCRAADVNSLPIAVLDDPDGITFVPSHFKEICENDDLTVIPLSTSVMQMDILLAWRSVDQTQTLLDFVEAIYSACIAFRKPSERFTR